MPKITSGDFKFLKDKIHKDKGYHEKEFMQRIDPDLIDRYYEGDPGNDYESETNEVSRITQNRLFPATSTLLTQLYPTNPKFVCSPKRESDVLNAKIAESALNYYYGQLNAVNENQLAVMSAWLYGIGYTKQGWRTVFKSPQKSEVATGDEGIGHKLLRKVGITLGARNTGIEENQDPEYIAEEGPFLEFINPKFILLDCDQPFGKGKYFTHHLKRTLYEVRTCGLYVLDDDFMNKFKRGKDEREVELDLYEQWIWNKDGMYIFVYCEGYDKPLRYERVPYESEGFPFKSIIFNIQSNRLYPISHMKVAQRAQRLDDYILTLQKQAIEQYKDITVWNGQAFDVQEKKAIRRNEIGTNVFTEKGLPPAGTFAHITSTGMPANEMQLVHTALDGNIREILTVIGARITGQSEFDTATQEKIGDFGNQLRSAGLQEQVRKFLVSQGKRMLQDLKQFDTAPHLFKITGLNLNDPVTGQLVTEKWLELGTQASPQTLREVIPQDLDIDIDVTELAHRDIGVVRKQIGEVIALVSNPAIQQALMAEGKKIRVGELVKDLISNFETLSNPDKYFEELPPPMAVGLPGLPGVPAGAIPATPISNPSEASMQTGINNLEG